MLMGIFVIVLVEGRRKRLEVEPGDSEIEMGGERMIMVEEERG